MGQTLTHGIYLPDEGERNCYNGLAANWSILDGAVGTIAEHTTALSGKAPLVHTHSKSDITDFPAYGTTAGTICEGNDSRLSDARTPVAHTHTKSDVTDLLNSNFIPSANNSYDLGSSSYQWNNLYAKNYYYNGVAWGLDKANVWTQNQTISINLPVFTLQDTIGVRDTTPANARNLIFSFLDKNGDSYGFINRQHKPVTGTHLHQVSINNGTYDYRLQFYLFTNGGSNFAPSNDGIIELGTSTNKWKTLNGVNPGALSLPSSYYVEIGTDGWDLSGANYNRVYINNANPTFPGILYIRINSTTASDILVRLFTTSGQEISYVGSKIETGSNNMIVTAPCPPSTNIYVSIKTSSTIYACRYYTLLGDPKFDSRSGS